MKVKKSVSKAVPGLAKGQLWKANDMHIRIVEMGKRLVHYKMVRDLNQIRRTQTTSLDTLEDYLKTNRARLVESQS